MTVILGYLDQHLLSLMQNLFPLTSLHADCMTTVILGITSTYKPTIHGNSVPFHTVARHLRSGSGLHSNATLGVSTLLMRSLMAIQ